MLQDKTSKIWEIRAEVFLKKSLEPIPQEMNEIDWKSGLSEKSERLAQHISAFSNQKGGGFIVFGVDNDGKIIGIGTHEANGAVQRIGNIARESVEPSVIIDHVVKVVENKAVLFISIEESPERPVHLRGKSPYDSYIRSAGQTRKMTRKEVAYAISDSAHEHFEENSASGLLTEAQVIDKLDHFSFFSLLFKQVPPTEEPILDTLLSEKMIRQEEGKYRITNLGAILFANNIEDFDHLKRKSVRVVIYGGKDRLNTKREQLGRKGYGNGFEGLIKFINDQLPSNEVIRGALRSEVKVYPEIAIRELVANALIHQDLSVTGTGPLVEIFDDRIEITSPGRPLISTMRFIDYPPRSRNEILASFMRRINVCEERGSGIDKVVAHCEAYQLPAPTFLGEGEDYLKAILYAPKPFSEMDKSDKIRACYQHCCLKYVSNDKMSNQSLRQRFGIEDSNYPIASRIISDTIDAQLIKPYDPKSSSKRYALYVPFWT